jgi:hypothetical protein
MLLAIQIGWRIQVIEKLPGDSKAWWVRCGKAQQAGAGFDESLSLVSFQIKLYDATLPHCPSPIA